MEFDDDIDAREIISENIDIDAIRKLIFDLLNAVGEDPEREGLKNTPDRVARMYTELLSGYSTDPERIINGALFNINYDEMVLVRDIEFYSLCEHHMLPFIGCLPTCWKSNWSFENSSHCRYVCAQTAGAGANDETDRRFITDNA